MKYQACFCEENIWHLAGDALGEEPRRVLLITNAAKRVALWAQKASSEPDGLVVWDYHVILQVGANVWDLDSRLAPPVALATYLEQTFRPTLPDYAPSFRAVEAAEFRQVFASDRRHMRDERGAWRSPPPKWPPIGAGHNLDRLLDLEDDFVGVTLEKEELNASWGPRRA